MDPPRPAGRGRLVATIHCGEDAWQFAQALGAVPFTTARAAGRPAMRIVQALYWLQDMLGDADSRRRITDRVRRILDDPGQGRAIRDDLRAGLSALPIWMQEFVRDLVSSSVAASGAPNDIRPRAGRRRKP